MLLLTLPTTLPQIFCEFTVYSWVIFKSSSVVWTYDAFENSFGFSHKLSKDLIEKCCFWPNPQLSLKYFVNVWLNQLFWWYLWNKSNSQKIFEGKMYIRNYPTKPLQIFFQFMLDFKVIFKSIIDPDDTCILSISLKQKQFSGNIWRKNVNQKLTNKAPWNIFPIHAWFQSYFQKYHRSRRQLSSTSPGLDGSCRSMWVL